MRPLLDHEGRPLTSIHIGGIHTSASPSVVRTVLGSCIAVCLHDPIARVGGMNHFMLPEGVAGEGEASRYGVHAMELLINGCMRAGADRRRMVAKVFGAAHVLNVAEGSDSVPRRNARFINEFLQIENIRVIAEDVGGYEPREVRFFTDTGQSFVRRLRATATTAVERLRSEEMASLRPAATSDDNVTLF